MSAEWKVRFLYPQHLKHHPLLYRLIRQFDLEANLIEAQVTDDGGFVVAALTGADDRLQDAMKWMAEQGVQVELLAEQEPGVAGS